MRESLISDKLSISLCQYWMIPLKKMSYKQEDQFGRLFLSTRKQSLYYGSGGVDLTWEIKSKQVGFCDLIHKMRFDEEEVFRWMDSYFLHSCWSWVVGVYLAVSFGFTWSHASNQYRSAWVLSTLSHSRCCINIFWMNANLTVRKRKGRINIIF